MGLGQCLGRVGGEPSTDSDASNNNSHEDSHASPGSPLQPGAMPCDQLPLVAAVVVAVRVSVSHPARVEQVSAVLG